jgi:hypothetical protein
MEPELVPLTNAFIRDFWCLKYLVYVNYPGPILNYCPFTTRLFTSTILNFIFFPSVPATPTFHSFGYSLLELEEPPVAVGSFGPS